MTVMMNRFDTPNALTLIVNPACRQDLAKDVLTTNKVRDGGPPSPPLSDLETAKSSELGANYIQWQTDHLQFPPFHPID